MRLTGAEINLKTNKTSAKITIREAAPLKITPCLLTINLPAINALNPNKADRLKMLDPMIMPTPTSCCPINKAVTADEISGVLAANAAIMPSKPPDKRKCVLSFSMLPPKMKLDDFIKTKHKENMNIADIIVINASFYVWSGFLCLLRIFQFSTSTKWFFFLS